MNFKFHLFFFNKLTRKVKVPWINRDGSFHPKRMSKIFEMVINIYIEKKTKSIELQKKQSQIYKEENI